ncbi:hypothetical protein INT46_006785 [Mucor plumbeus]|uniref:Uncharacterized protein n=1 Tax=Mucor plumbeus TaxID=97098 RepID=A0A8H7VCN3_9FUNG|nr:hypothetical protein INT46_006785 [Mucor plumbeus]
MTPAEVKGIMGTEVTTENLSNSQGSAARILNSQLKIDTSSSGVSTVRIHSMQSSCYSSQEFNFFFIQKNYLIMVI